MNTHPRYIYISRDVISWGAISADWIYEPGVRVKLQKIYSGKGAYIFVDELKSSLGPELAKKFGKSILEMTSPAGMYMLRGFTPAMKFYDKLSGWVPERKSPALRLPNMNDLPEYLILDPLIEILNLEEP